MSAKGIAVLASLILTASAAAQSTAFTYQGRLKNGTQPAAGLHDFRFRLWDAASGGSQMGPVQCVDNILVAEGLFAATIDFGQQFATPAQRFLEIEVRADTGLTCASATGFVVLGPRQLLTAAPLSSHAKSAFSLDAPDGSPVNAVFVDNDGNVGIGTVTPDLLGYGSSVLSVGGARPRLEFQGSSATSQNLGILDFLNGNAGVASMVVSADPATNSAHMNLHTKSLWLTGGNGAGLPTSEGPGLRMYYDAAGDRAQIFAFNYQNATPRHLILQDITGGNVGIGTGSPLAKLDVRGDIRLGPSGQFRAASGTENLRIVRGTVRSDGGIVTGTGFSAVRTSQGRYTITFDTPFAAAPTVTATVRFVPFETTAIFAMTVDVSSVSAQIRLTDTDRSLWDSEFHVIAIGPR